MINSSNTWVYLVYSNNDTIYKNNCLDMKILKSFINRFVFITTPADISATVLWLQIE